MVNNPLNQKGRTRNYKPRKPWSQQSSSVGKTGVQNLSNWIFEKTFPWKRDGSENISTNTKWATKKTLLLSIESCLVYRDPYIGLLKSPYNWVGSHPLYNLNNQGPFFHWPYVVFGWVFAGHQGRRLLVSCLAKVTRWRYRSPITITRENHILGIVLRSPK